MTGIELTPPKPAPPGGHMTVAVPEVYTEVRLEQLRAMEIHGPQFGLADGTNTDLVELANEAKADVAASAAAGQLTWLEVLLEEVAEVSAEVDPIRLRTEAIQVAATAIRWVTALDARHPWNARVVVDDVTEVHTVEVRRGDHLLETVTLTAEDVFNGVGVALDPYRPGHLRIVHTEGKS